MRCSQRLATTGYKRLQRLNEPASVAPALMRGTVIAVTTVTARARTNEEGGAGDGRGKKKREGQGIRPVGEKRPAARPRRKPDSSVFAAVSESA